MRNTPERSWYHEYVRNSNRLLITAGDSWTWGDSLGKINGEFQLEDYEYRTTHVFGALLSKRFDADFLNIATPGSSNASAYDKIKMALLEVVDRYRQIDVILPLTENGREIIGDPRWTHLLDTSSLSSMLCSYERNMFDSFNQLKNEFPTVNFIITRNFTFTFEENRHFVDVPKSWVEILEEHQTIDPYPRTTRAVSMMAINPIIEYLNNINQAPNFKVEMIELFHQGEVAINWLDNSQLNNQMATRHPTERAHELWADYIEQFLR